MNTKIKKLLFELTRNSRITTKELGKRLKTSQQSCSYLIKQLKKKNIIRQFTTIIDSVKLGYMNIVVGFDFIDLQHSVKKEIIDYLKDHDYVIGIEEAKQGVDMIIEYSSPNLSAFNKSHSEFINKFNKNIKTKFAFPMIVRHKYFKNYLTKSNDTKDIILCGDRNIINISEQERSLLAEMIKEPDSRIINLAKKSGLSVKSVSKIKKQLEKNRIIKGYSCTFNYNKLGISRYFFFIKFSSQGIKEIEKLIEYSKQDKNIVEAVKLIGEFNIMLKIEEIKKKDIIRDIRSNFKIEDYFIVEMDSIIKKQFIPISF